MPSRIVELRSPRNPFLQEVRTAASDGRPTADGLVVAEGPHLLAEAAKGPWRLEKLIATSAALESWLPALQGADVELFAVPAATLQAVAATNTSQGIIGLVRPKTWSWDDLASAPPLILALDRIQDPGNAGTILRAAEAFGATGVVLLEGSVQTANGKLVRAAAGSLFRLPVLERVSPAALLLEAARRRLNLLALDRRGGASLRETAWNNGCVLVVGNEGSGISPSLRDAATLISIPTRAVESLNAAMASSIALYEAAGHRSRT